MLNEYRWLPLLYIGFAVGVVVLLVLEMTMVDFEDSMFVLSLTLMVVVYTAALMGVCVRALKRIESKLETTADNR